MYEKKVDINIDRCGRYGGGVLNNPSLVLADTGTWTNGATSSVFTSGSGSDSSDNSIQVTASVESSYKVELPAMVIVNYHDDGEFGGYYDNYTDNIIAVNNCNLPANKVLNIDISNSYTPVEMEDRYFAFYTIPDFLVGKNNPDIKLPVDIKLGVNDSNGSCLEAGTMLSYSRGDDIVGTHSTFSYYGAALPINLGTYGQQILISEQNSEYVGYTDAEGSWHDSGGYEISCSGGDDNYITRIMFCGQGMSDEHLYKLGQGVESKADLIKDDMLSDDIQFTFEMHVVTDIDDHNTRPTPEKSHFRYGMNDSPIPADTYEGTLQFTWAVQDNPYWVADHP